MQNLCLVQKRLKRRKALCQSTSIGVEDKKKYFPCLSSVDYISSEHSMSEDNSVGGNSSSDDEDAPKRKVLCRRPLQWRSMELNSLFSRLDRKSARKQSKRSASMMIDRKDGPPSNREAPEDAPAFALLHWKEKYFFKCLSNNHLNAIYVRYKEKVLLITTAWLKQFKIKRNTEFGHLFSFLMLLFCI